MGGISMVGPPAERPSDDGPSASAAVGAVGAGWLCERRAILAVLAAESILTWCGVLYYLLARTPIPGMAQWAYYVVAPVVTVMFWAYLRGWEPARYVTVVVNAVMIGAIMPLPSERFDYFPHAFIIPSALALVLGGPRWVVASAGATFAIFLLRAGGFTGYLSPAHLLALAITITCLVVSRLVVDAARQEAELRARQAELARQEIQAQEEALRANEMQHRALIDAIPDSLYRIDRHGTILERRAPSDRRALLHTVYEGRTLDDLLGPEIGGQLGRAIEQTLATTHPSVVEYERREGDETHYREARIVALEGDQVLALIRDIGERKEAERQRELFERGQRLRALGQMAGGIAHDLNQALAVVTGYAELAIDDLWQLPNTAATRGFLETVTQAAMQGSDSVKRLLTFARQQDQGPIERVDVAQVVEDTARFTAPQWRDRTQAEGRPVVLETQVEPGLRVRGWATALREALMNLVLNAVDAMPDGGTIVVSARREGDLALVEVADSGFGMPPSVQEHIFEPFYTTKGELGTGLGLAMVFGIVERHGGEIAVRSVPGEGTTFSLRLPLDADGASSALSPTVPTSVLPIRVLVVDDEPQLARMLAAMLARDRHDVEVATSGEEAVTQLEAGGYDVVISDLSMGSGMNGWQLAEEVARRWPDTHVVLASGWGAGIGEQEARERSVDGVLAKPYRLDDVRTVLGRLT